MLIDQRVDNRVTTFTSTLRDNCQEKVLEEATRIVDSIIISEARLKTDTIAKPFRPDRPDIPEVKKLKDTLPVAPLFPDSLPIDVDSFPPVKKNEG